MGRVDLTTDRRADSVRACVGNIGVTGDVAEWLKAAVC